MSTPRPNFVLISELQTLNRRDFPLSTTDVANLGPLSANPILDGEWLELESVSAYNLRRGGAAGANTGLGGTKEAVVPSWPVHTELGRYDTQAIQKTNVLFMGMYEAETLIVDSTGVVIGDPLTVQDVTLGGLTKRALKKAVAVTPGSSGVYVVGQVTKLIGNAGAGGKIRFIHFGYQKIF